MPTREEIAQAIYGSHESYVGSIEDCLIAADAVIALSSKPPVIITRALTGEFEIPIQNPVSCSICGKAMEDRGAVDQWCKECSI